MVCDKCGKWLAVGEWPFCGGKNAHGFPVSGLAIIDDQLEGGPRHFETLGHDAPFIESKSQWKREMALRNLECVGDRKPAEYFRAVFRRHDEERRDTGTNREY